MIVRCRVFVPYGCETVHCSWQRNRFFPWLKLSVTWLKIVLSLALSLILTTTFWPTKMAHDTEARMRCCTLPSPICEVRACSRNLFSDPATRNIIFWLADSSLIQDSCMDGLSRKTCLACPDIDALIFFFWGTHTSHGWKLTKLCTKVIHNKSTISATAAQL